MTVKTKPEVGIHPLAAVFPMMHGKEFEHFVQDIRKNGLREPIVTYEDMILDGRTRNRACQDAGVDPTFVP